MDFAHRIFFLDIGYFGGFRHRKVIYYTPYVGLIKLVKTANTQTEWEKIDERYMRFSIMKRQNPSIKYPFRNPAFKCKKNGINPEYLCKICDHSGNGSDTYEGSRLMSHIYEHTENGEW